MRQIIVILGQTATGKSALAVKIALRLRRGLSAPKINGEIISADSRQVYKGLDIGTGKIKRKEMRGIPHHLLDVANPKKQFTAAEFQKLATSAMADIIKEGKTPIICGGTGFYISLLTENISLPDVPPNSKLRRTLAIRSGRFLLLMLKKLDPERARNIDQNNKVKIKR